LLVTHAGGLVCGRDGAGDRDGQSDRRGLDGVGGDGDHQPACANGDAAFGKELAQAFDGAAASLVPRAWPTSRSDLFSK
jgi:hypothetical protein